MYGKTISFKAAVQLDNVVGICYSPPLKVSNNVDLLSLSFLGLCPSSETVTEIRLTQWFCINGWYFRPSCRRCLGLHTWLSNLVQLVFFPSIEFFLILVFVTKGYWCVTKSILVHPIKKFFRINF